MIALRGIIRRRLLLNFAVDPEVIAPLLPPPFEPQLVHGVAVAGICLIRLEEIRPRSMALPFGLSSENAAHRIAVRWTDALGKDRAGVWIPRRDTDSRLNELAGGRLFPSVHHRATFDVDNSDEHFSIRMKSVDESTTISVDARLASALPRSSIFPSLQEVSAFFQGGASGYSPDLRGGIAGVRLETKRWEMSPLDVERVESSFFDDRTRFPAGSVRFDCALLMRNLEHEWHSEAAPPRDTRPRLAG